MHSRPPILTQTCNSPCGKLVLGSCRDGLCLCDWAESPQHARVLARLRAQAGCRLLPGHSEVLDAAAAQLDEYFCGRRQHFDLMTLSNGTAFQRDVWRELIRIPFGRTMTYGELAARIGRPKAVRAVANAVGANALSLFIPCHRVTAAGGRPGGYRGGLAAKNYLLRLERRTPPL